MHGEQVFFSVDQLVLIYLYIAGNNMPTDACTHIHHIRIAGSSAMLVVPNVELSPRDRYSHAKLKTARILLFCLVLKYRVIF